MSFGVQTEGFNAKRFTDILESVSGKLKTELNIDIDSNPDAVAKVLTNIIGLAQADTWEATQALQSMFDIDKAEGIHLDNLVGYLGMYRLPESKTNGDAYITSTEAVTIPAESEFSDISGNTYTNPDTIFASLNNTVECTFIVTPTLSSGDVISITINDITTTVPFTFQLVNTVAIMAGTLNNISDDTGMTAVAAVDGLDTIITLTNVSDTASSIVDTPVNMTVSQIISRGNVESTVSGVSQTETNQLTVPPSISGITSVDNRYAFESGRYQESDAELRARHSLSLATSGAATVDAIRADLLNITGVTSASVIENDTLEVSVDGVAKKGFTCVVKGGDNTDIANSIWTSKGAGIATSGNISEAITDSQGNLQGINFSRPDQQYVHINIEYSKHDEDLGSFPSDAESQMGAAVMSYSSDFTVGQDVIPQRIAAQMFNTITGLSYVNVTAGTTVGGNDVTPTLTNSIIKVSAVEEASFDLSRITYTEV